MLPEKYQFTKNLLFFSENSDSFPIRTDFYMALANTEF